ncbi:SRPBCC family protein [Rhodoplanes sp. TEM]|uniref:SRPBCC family protein n=1 Tax=Rhodoplanes tepidamans TaxID=200616 RepID=A0ABT5JH49_RHOTP|nr:MULTISPECIES: SRPBCC family protein [Rhodoplanes]MDC7789045.1 SRPBCC family protein [Rhodoplanes tepidamans]MDC7987344.1 SRPBCC family protein [Rhodoplanes sp. TEM]MDQ0354928.1 carbon monoxide dehydrogenase subunit G [Rhodoplanes tepidamans]
MQFENSFDVSLPPDVAWRRLIDIPRIAPCLPGAELTDVTDTGEFLGRFSVRVGPVRLRFDGRARIVALDDVARTARVECEGLDEGRRGTVMAVVDFRLEPTAAGSRVVVTTDLTLAGPITRYVRGTAVYRDIAAYLLQDFAETLDQTVAAEADATGIAPDAGGPAPAVDGLHVLGRAIGSAVGLRRIG